MRIIGHVDGETKARNFADYLFVHGIENQIEREKDGTFAVWIHREEDLDRGRTLLNNYIANPSDPRFLNHAAAAEELREQKQREQEEYEKRMKKGRQLFRPMAAYGFGPVTSLLILICIVVFILKSVNGSWIVPLFKFTNMDLVAVREMGIWEAFLTRITHLNILIPEIRSGEIWRLITPIFLHFGFLHIFFNMLWLRDLGSMIEARQSSLLLIVMVLVIAVISNFAEFLFVGAGTFGGMSGVVYGLLGYLWIRGKLDPSYGLFLHPSTVTMMIIWLFVCMIGVFGPIANAAHASGLLLGMAWGFLSSLRHR